MFVVIENTVSSFSIFYDKISVAVIGLSGTKLDKWKGFALDRSISSFFITANSILQQNLC